MMAIGSNFVVGNATPCTAGEDLEQGDLVYIATGTPDTVKKAVAGDGPIGVVLFETASGDRVDVVTQGVAAVRVASGTAVAIGDTLVATATAGQVAVAASPASVDVIGTARRAIDTSGSGQILIVALLNIHYANA